MSAATPQSPRRRIVGAIERANVVLALAALALTHLLAGVGPLLYGAVFGAVVGILNFRLLVWLGERLLRAPQRSKGFYSALFAIKIVAVLTVVGLVLRYTGVEPLGFLIGISTLLPAIFGVGLFASLAPADDPHTPREAEA